MNCWYRLQILQQLLLPIIMLAVLTMIGVAGYMFIEQYTFLEALYMTVITVASIGYNEVKPLSDNGRIFTIILVILNLGILTYSSLRSPVFLWMVILLNNTNYTKCKMPLSS